MIQFNEPFLTGNELNYIQDVVKRRHFYGNGHYTKKCQRLIQQTIKTKEHTPQVLLTDSCTSALEITALLLRDWNKKQEVIVPSYTFSSTAAAFAKVGYKIIFAEIDPRSMMIDINDVKKKISSKTTAIVVVHYGGFGVKNLIEYKKLCKNAKLYLIEDAAQAYRCKQDDYYLGTIGDLSCLSFHETKNIHSGLGGALLINNKKFNKRATYIWERGTNRQEVLNGVIDKYSWVEIGGSFYPTELQAAFLLAQLEKVKENFQQRKNIFLGYYNSLKSNPTNEFYHPQLEPNYQTNFHAFWIMFKSKKQLNLIKNKLLVKNIHAYIGYVPLHSSKVGKTMGYKKNDLKITEKYSQQILRLPLHNNMTKEDAINIANLIIKLIKKKDVPS